MKFLKALALCDVGYYLEGLGATVKHCNHLKVIDIRYAKGSLYHFLEHVPNPSMCSLSIKGSRLASTEAEKFASLLPSFDVTHLDLYLAECSSEAAPSLAAAIEHRTVEETELSLPPAEALCQSLPQFPSLQTLEISGLSECSDEVVTRLVAAIKHGTLKYLKLSEINLTSTVAEALGQSLSELLALQRLDLIRQKTNEKVLFANFTEDNQSVG